MRKNIKHGVTTVSVVLRAGAWCAPWFIFTVCLMVFLGVPPAVSGQVKVVPQHEHEIAEEQGVKGPTETKGVESVTLLGQVALAGEFQSLDERVMRVREIAIAPGGVVAVHQHEARPGVAYILEGEIMEFRNDEKQALLRTVGEVAFERTGVIHWWENQSNARVRALVVDIVKQEP